MKTETAKDTLPFTCTPAYDRDACKGCVCSTCYEQEFCDRCSSCVWSRVTGRNGVTLMREPTIINPCQKRPSGNISRRSRL